MPTGGGKSLTFQLPAAIGQGITIVIMPLISLIHDQVGAMKALNLRAEKLTGSVPFPVQQQIISDCYQPHNYPQIIFITPEKLFSGEYIKT